MQKKWIGICALCVPLVACGNGSKNNDKNAATNNSTTSNNSTTTNNMTTTNNVTSNNASNNMTPGPRTFRVTLENHSQQTGHRTALSPSVWSLSSAPIILAGDQPDGLESFAEDGMPDDYATTLMADAVQVGVGDAALAPGESATWDISASPGDPGFQLAAMVVESNDRLIATTAPTVLFDEAGDPIETRELALTYWDAGTEANEVLFMGPHQAPRQSEPNSGSPEGVVRLFEDTTRGLPCASAIGRIEVEEDGGTFTITLFNGSMDGRQFVSALGPMFYAVHDDTWTLFEEGGTANAALEAHIEVGDPTALIAEAQAAAGVLDAGRTLGVNSPGQSYSIEVTPDAAHPRLTFAAMILRTNDAFLSTVGGVPLINEAGELRDAADIQTDLNARIAIYDGGTEENEVPAGGQNQGDIGTALPDPDTTIRQYRDSTNDFDGEMAGGLMSISVVNGVNAGEFDVTITNNASSTAWFSALFSGLAWATHSEPLEFFTVGEAASPGLELLAEDGDPTDLAAEFATTQGVGMSGTHGTAIPPLETGQSFQFTITADATNRFFTFASMIAPTNDTFFTMQGLELFDDTGAARSDVDIAASIAVSVWDAGTEVNQAAAGGADQWPRGVLAAGPAEGNGRVRDASDTTYPLTDSNYLFRLRIEPLPEE